MFGIGRLEERCISCLAENFLYFVKRPDFAELIVSDAASIKNRQAEDSIDIVDELKFQFTKFENCVELSRLLDERLEELGLKTFGVFYN